MSLADLDGVKGCRIVAFSLHEARVQIMPPLGPCCVFSENQKEVSGILLHAITEVTVYLIVIQWITGKESDMVERPKFFQAHDRLQEQTLALYTQESWDHLMGYSAWWNALIHINLRKFFHFLGRKGDPGGDGE